MIFPQKEDSRSKAQNGLWALNKFETFFHWGKKSAVLGNPNSMVKTLKKNQRKNQKPKWKIHKIEKKNSKKGKGKSRKLEKKGK